MRVPVVFAAVIACVVAVPRNLLQPYPTPRYDVPVQDVSIAVDPEALAPAAPTIPAGDINGAIIDAHVENADHTRAAIDTAQQIQDKAKEVQGQAIDVAEEHAWRAVDAAKTATARLDGATAAAAPAIAKTLARSSSIVEPYISDVVGSASTYSPTVYASVPVEYQTVPVVFGPAQASYAIRYAPAQLAGFSPTYADENTAYAAPAAFNIAPREFVASAPQNSPFYSYPGSVGQDLYSAAVEAIPQPYYYRGELLTHTL